MPFLTGTMGSPRNRVYIPKYGFADKPRPDLEPGYTPGALGGPSPSSPTSMSRRVTRRVAPIVPITNTLLSLGGATGQVPTPLVTPPELEEKTLGDPRLQELVDAARDDRLRLNRGGLLTTPRTRRVVRGLTGARRRLAGASGINTGLGPNADAFADALQRSTGFSPRAVGAWVASEGGAFENGGEAGPQNWLGVGYPGEPTPFGRSAYFSGSPRRAGRATGQWIKGEIGDEYGYGAAPTIEAMIPAAAGGTDQDFINALAASQWGTNVAHVAENLANVSVSQDPGAQRAYRRAATRARRAGIDPQSIAPPAGAPEATLVSQRQGPYAGSRRVVSSLLGQPVWGDKEPGHSAGGMHDPANPDAYAQDIGSAYTQGNPAEGEPAYGQGTVSEVVENLRRRGAEIPSDFQLGSNWEGNVDGYDIEFLTAPHGTGPHIHLGAEWTGEAAPSGTYAGAPGGVGGTAATLISAGVPAPLVGQAVAQAQAQPMIPLSPIEAPITTEVPLPEGYADAPSSGAPDGEDESRALLDLLTAAYAPALVGTRRRRRA